jgi:four helix bundle protein
MEDGEAMPDEGDPRDLRDRTKRFALEIVRLYSSLPKTTEAQVLGKQLLRSGTSVGAHYREGVRARSPAESVTKLEVGLQELEETGYWLELMSELPILNGPATADLRREVDQLTAMLVSSVRTVKAKSRKDQA